jgi:hypothetical protein
MLDNAVYDNSILILSDGEILEKNKDYYFSNGIIDFSKVFNPPIIVIYEKTEDKIAYSYKKFSQEKDEETIPEYNEMPADSKGNVAIIGAKSFQIVSQSGNLSMDQSLDVSVAGNISDDWSIEGRIYDNTSDINSTSLNSPLSQLENIFISVYGLKGEGVLGSTSFSGFTNEFSRFNREIFGVKFTSKILNYPFSISAAGQKGRIASASFYCIQGIQGPYPLTETANLSMYVIAPQSEKIYLNGELQKSGEDNDYTIDYYNGEITFTLKRTVDDRSFVYAEFQTYEELSPVTGYFFKSGEDTSGFSALFSHEEQSAVDKESEELLKTIPSDSSAFLLEGFTFVGMGNGEYLLNDSVFVYAGEKGGDYTVDFYYVGYQKGDYAYSPIINAYVYAGKNFGNYSVYRTLELPFSTDYLSLSFIKDTYLGKFYIEACDGFYRNNRYSNDNARESGLSYKAKYLTKTISFGRISMNFSAEHASRSDVYRNKWSSNVSGEEIFYTIAKSIYAENETRFKEHARFENIFDIDGYYGFLDSIDDSYYKISSDTLFELFSSFEKRITGTADTSYYDASLLTAGRRFSPFVLYGIYGNEFKLNETAETKGGAVSFRNTSFRMEYDFEKRSSDSIIKSKANIIKGEFSKSWTLFRMYLMTEYRRTENLLLSKDTDQFGLNSNSSLLLGPLLSVNNSLRITSLSTYIDRDSYVFVGAGKGDYVYDGESGTYIYDDIYGEYVKITERSASADPVSGRDFSINLKSFVKKTDIAFSASYQDLSKNFFNFDSSSFVSRIYDIRGKFLYSFNSSFKIFDEASLANDFRENISAFNSLKEEFGITGGEDPFPYTLSCIFTNEEQKYSNGFYSLGSRIISAKINPSQNRSMYDITVDFGFFDGEYEYGGAYPTLIEGKTLSGDIRTTLGAENGFSLLINPYVSYNEYTKGDSGPLTIHYKYPEGILLKGTVSVIYSNGFLNAALSYIGEFEKRYGFRQRTEATLSTYF